MKFRMLFAVVLIDFPNSKVCLIGEWSIVHGEYQLWKHHVNLLSPSFRSVTQIFLNAVNEDEGEALKIRANGIGSLAVINLRGVSTK